MKPRILRETEHAVIVKNRTLYDYWEMQKVTDHLMVIPKRHVASLAELTSEERLDVMNLCAEYEAQSYNIYARGVKSNRRSMAHQHTHLIKIDDKETKFYLAIRKPYFLFKV